MRYLIIVYCYFSFSTVFAQDRLLPIAQPFKDQAHHSGTNFTPVFPITNSVAKYYKMTMDSSKRYSAVGYFLYKRELIELKTAEGNLWITPLFDVSMGKGMTDSSRISQNTRGMRVEGTFGEKVFYSTSFYENQAVFTHYFSDYISQRGELYYKPADSSYYTQNAVVPGAARTKPFKTNGYDYTFAFGNIHWKMTKKITVDWGNNAYFVGSGYRSMLWSDNSIRAINLRATMQLTPRISWQFVRMRGLNLLRKPFAENAEAYYEPTSLSFQTIYFQPTKNSSIGIFEGGNWLRGDSLQKTPIQGLYFLPLPGITSLQEKWKNDAYSLIGIDGKIHFNNWMIYGQLGRSFFTKNSAVGQVGARFHWFNNKSCFLQIEYNFAEKNAYLAIQPRINYANYQLPLAHPMGSNLSEFVVRFNGEWKRFFINGTINYYAKQNSNYQSLLPLYVEQVNTNQQVYHQLIELGYHFNKAIGFQVFGSVRYRQLIDEKSANTWVNVGIRTQLINHYSDF